MYVRTEKSFEIQALKDDTLARRLYISLIRVLYQTISIVVTTSKTPWRAYDSQSGVLIASCCVTVKTEIKK